MRRRVEKQRCIGSSLPRAVCPHKPNDRASTAWTSEATRCYNHSEGAVAGTGSDSVCKRTGKELYSRRAPTPWARGQVKDLILNSVHVLTVCVYLTLFSSQSGLVPGGIIMTMASQMKRLTAGGRLTWRRKSAARGSVPTWSITWREKVKQSWGYFIWTRWRTCSVMMAVNWHSVSRN